MSKKTVARWLEDRGLHSAQMAEHTKGYARDWLIVDASYFKAAAESIDVLCTLLISLSDAGIEVKDGKVVGKYVRICDQNSCEGPQFISRLFTGEAQLPAPKGEPKHEHC